MNPYRSPDQAPAPDPKHRNRCVDAYFLGLFTGVLIVSALCWILRI